MSRTPIADACARKIAQAEYPEFCESFKPAPVKGAHRWRVEGGPTTSHGTGAVCEACGLRVVARVDALGLTLAPALYHADKPGLPFVATRDRCTAQEPRR